MASAVDSPKAHSWSWIVWTLGGPLKETATEMTTVVHKMNQMLDSETQERCYRSEGSAAIRPLGSANARAQSLSPTYEDQVVSYFSTLGHERVNGMPLDTGIVPLQQKSSTAGKTDLLLCPLRYADHRESSKVCLVRLVEHEERSGRFHLSDRSTRVLLESSHDILGRQQSRQAALHCTAASHSDQWVFYSI